MSEQVAKPHEQERFGRIAFHADLRDVAQAFKRLQASRERADHDPLATLTIVEAQAAMDDAERAIRFFTASPEDERSDVLALMLGGGRI